MPCSKKWLLGLIPPSIAAVSFLLSGVSNFWCETVKFVPDTTESSSLTWLDFTPPTIQIGPWYRQETVLVSVNPGLGEPRFFVRQVCRAYPSENDSISIDSAWRTVRAFSLLTLLLGGFLIAALLYNNCTYYFTASGWRCLALQFLLTLPLCQGLTLLLLQSTACTEHPLATTAALPEGDAVVTDAMWAEFIATVYGADCEWSTGMTCNVWALVGWCTTGVAMLVMGAPVVPPTSPPETQHVTYQRTVHADGTTTVTQTNVVKGTAVVPPEGAVTAGLS